MEFEDAIKRVHELVIEPRMGLSQTIVGDRAVPVLHIEHPRHGHLAFNISQANVEWLMTALIDLMRQRAEAGQGQQAANVVPMQ